MFMSKVDADPCQDAKPLHQQLLGPTVMRPAAGTMTNKAKVHLAVGLFGTVKELASALAELSAEGLMPAQSNVISRAGALEWAPGWCKQEDTFVNWIVCRPTGDAVPWAIAPVGQDGTAQSTSVNDALAFLGFQHWALRRQAQQLHHCLEQGGALLLVEPHNEAEERAACTVLLRYASGGIQTHEFARP